MREIGGKNDRLVAESVSARLGRGLFSSIRETVSITGFGGVFGASADLAGSAGDLAAVSA
jgi:hypothetical protein